MDVKSYLFDKTTRQMVYKTLDATMMRQRAISNNIANAGTVGYLRKEVSFEDQLKAVMEKKLDGTKTNEAHMDLGRAQEIKKVKPLAYEANDPTLPGEINNVDIDLEMSKLAENQIHYQFATRFAGFDKYLAAIKGSGQ